MPTLVKFTGGTDLTLKEDFEKVNAQLTGANAGLFNSERGRRVVVYRENVLYIEDREGTGGAAGFA